MTQLQILITSLYQFLGLLLTLYGLFVLSSIILFVLYRRRHDWPRQEMTVTEWPLVTVQLPIYNEPHVAVRLLEAVAGFDYPVGRLQIQVLDDSTDQTASILARQVETLRRQRGLNISYHHRSDRSGYKAGALAAALPECQGEYLAVFDADFAPSPDWLRRTLPALIANKRPGLRANTLGASEPQAKHPHRRPKPGPGRPLCGRTTSAFRRRFPAKLQWQRRFVAGASHHRSGWLDRRHRHRRSRSVLSRPIVGLARRLYQRCHRPGGIAAAAFQLRRQQRRWAKGSAQTLRKLGGELLRSDQLLVKTIYALLHLGGYATHLPLLALFILTLPLALLPDRTLPLPFIGTISLLVSVAPFLLYTLAQQRLDGWQGLRRLWALPALALISLGMSPAMGRSVWEGFRHKGGAFERTPKQGGGPVHLAMPEDANWRQFWPEMLAGLLRRADPARHLVHRSLGGCSPASFLHPGLSGLSSSTACATPGRFALIVQGGGQRRNDTGSRLATSSPADTCGGGASVLGDGIGGAGSRHFHSQRASSSGPGGIAA